MNEMTNDAAVAECPKCGAPCDTFVHMRGGDYGWGTTDLERTDYKYSAPAAAGAQGEAIAWTRDAETWGNALNEAAWTFVDECPEKSALLFNNTKGPLRAAILKYAELVGAATPQPAPQRLAQGEYIPEGWALVPIEPTDEMLDAPNTIIQRYGARLIWKRMLDAAVIAPRNGEPDEH
jgi:hypothetical protein